MNVKPRRKTISAKARFDVFKRDRFTCQYCGAHPPGVLLHLDHVLAVSAGGSNDEDNLVTACEACNLGKGARDLKVAPQSMSEKAKETAEREAQLAGYNAIFEAKRKRIEDDVWRVLQALHGPQCVRVKQDEYSSVRRFVELIGVQACLDSVESALGANLHDRRTWLYFCSVCWRKSREAKQ